MMGHPECADSGGLLAGADFVEGFAAGGEPEIVAALEADPELGGVAEVAAEAQGGVGGDAALAADQVVDARRGDVEFLGETVGGEAEGFHELREENLAGMDSEGDFVRGFLLVELNHEVCGRGSIPVPISAVKTSLRG